MQAQRERGSAHKKSEENRCDNKELDGTRGRVDVTKNSDGKVVITPRRTKDGFGDGYKPRGESAKVRTKLEFKLHHKAKIRYCEYETAKNGSAVARYGADATSNSSDKVRTNLRKVSEVGGRSNRSKNTAKDRGNAQDVFVSQDCSNCISNFDKDAARDV